MHGKDISKFIIALALAYVLVMPIVNQFLQLGLDSGDICKYTITIFSLQSPFNISVWFDKITGRGKSE